jgi:hypothetical protein
MIARVLRAIVKPLPEIIMPRAVLAVSLLLLAACESTPLDPVDLPLARVAAFGSTFSFTTIEVPGATATTAWGINQRGDVAGGYVDAGGFSHGFLLSEVTFTTIDVPGAANTDARGIGPNGEVVGTYRMPGETAVTFHGYRRSVSGEILSADYPGYNEIPARLLPDGTILGCRHANDMMGSMRGITMGRDGNTELDVFASMNNGATPDLRRIVGLYTNMDVTPARQEGYVVEDGVFTPFLVPGSQTTAAWDINPAGQIVGVYRDATGFHGFVRTGDEYVPVNVPGASATRVFGINARGDIVGTYVAGNRTVGFVARAER